MREICSLAIICLIFSNAAVARDSSSFMTALEVLYSGRHGGIPWGEITRSTKEIKSIPSNGLCIVGDMTESSKQAVFDFVSVVNFFSKNDFSANFVSVADDCHLTTKVLIRFELNAFSYDNYLDDLKYVSNLVDRKEIANFPVPNKYSDPFPGQVITFRFDDDFFIYSRISSLRDINIVGVGTEKSVFVRSIIIEELFHIFSGASDPDYQDNFWQPRSILAGTDLIVPVFDTEEMTLSYPIPPSEPEGLCALDFVILSMVNSINMDGALSYHNVSNRILESYDKFISTAKSAIKTDAGRRVFGKC